VIKRDYGITKLRRRLDDEDTAAFWEMAENAAAPAIEGAGRR
jgi:hypothetical protein